MTVRIYPPHLHGSITIPSSKSHTMRALLCAGLARGESSIESPLLSADTRTACAVLEQLGVQIAESSDIPKRLTVIPSKRCFASPQKPCFVAPTENGSGSSGGFSQQKTAEEIPLNFENSGSLLYFLGVLLTAANRRYCFSGDASLNSRPVEPLLAIYRQAGLSFSCSSTAADKGGAAVPPLRVSGQLPAQDYELYGPFSQPVTGLLYAAPLLNGATRIFFKNAGETPYLRMTVQWLKKAGIEIESSTDCTEFAVKGGQVYQPLSSKITGDWSSAAFPLAAALVCNSAVQLCNLDPFDVQGDARILSIIKQMGARFSVNAEKQCIQLEPSADFLRGGSFDCGDIPDAVPALAAIACFAKGKTTLTNVEVCRFKECDRLHAIAEQADLFGAAITEGKDFLCIEGGGVLRPARVHSLGDHRIAMMLAVIACGIAARFPHAEPSCIEDFDCVSVSYPSFLQDFTALGVDIRSC